MRMRTADEGRDQRAGRGNVIDETAIAGQQRLVFQAGDTRSDQFIHAVCLCWLNDSYVLLPLNRATSLDQITRAMSDSPEIGLAAGGCMSEDAGRNGTLRHRRRLRKLRVQIRRELADDLRRGRLDHADAAAILRDRPDSISSVWMRTVEPAPAGSMRNAAVALAPPRPLASLPCALTRAVWLAASI